MLSKDRMKGLKLVILNVQAVKLFLIQAATNDKDEPFYDTAHAG